LARAASDGVFFGKLLYDGCFPDLILKEIRKAHWPGFESWLYWGPIALKRESSGITIWIQTGPVFWGNSISLFDGRHF
jgi:hypothetical protein